MGNNSAFTVFEATVVGIYDLGKLDRKVLAVLMEPYRDSDADSGGKAGLTGKDGLEVEEIVIKVMGGRLPARPKLPKNYLEWTPKQHQANEAHHEAVAGAFREITSRFGWC
jgi:hypothetical protein